MNRKGFTKVVLVVLVIILATVLIYFDFFKKPDENDYLVIREWGVELKKPAGMDDLEYMIAPGDKTKNSVYFSTQRLINLEESTTTGKNYCGTDQGPLGYLARTSSLSDFGDRYIPTNIKISNYYYWFAGPQATCSDNKQVQQLQTQQVNTLATTILKNLRLVYSQNETASWQIYKGQKFQLLIPPQWHEDPDRPGILQPAYNSPYYLIFDVIDLLQDQGGDTQTMALFRNGKLLEAEKAIAKSMCGETSACGEIVESKSISVSGGVGIEFVVQYKGLRIDEPRGLSNEIHRAILKNNALYRFWTSEQVAPAELRNKYPKLDPSPTELFRKIMNTFKTL